jgi:hypothetical protein
MAKWYHYLLEVWLWLKKPPNAPELEDELRQYLGESYQVNDLCVFDDPESEKESEVTVSLRLQLSFAETEMRSRQSRQEPPAARPPVTVFASLSGDGA